jgi:LacI family transcriptional regulator
MKNYCRIAVLLGQEVNFCRQALLGIRAYARGKKHWQLHYAVPEREVIRSLREWQPHGMIAHLMDACFAREVLKLRKPLVDIAYAIPDLKVPVVDVDHQAIGRLAAAHFLERGYRNFGFFGGDTILYSCVREASFREVLQKAGYLVSTCHMEYVPRLSSKSSWKSVNRQVENWLRRLPKPVAILTANDMPAHDLADICQQLETRIPEEVALLGVDNDELECQLAHPPLSSVALPAERVGYEAAHLLDRILAGEKPPEKPVFLPPIRVVVRHSTSIIAVNDPIVAAALGYIHEHYVEKLSVKILAGELSIRRRVLEQKFRSQLNSSVLDQIHRQRIERVKELLCVTDLKIAAIAKHTGFLRSQTLATVFRKFTGITPRDYRLQSKLMT